MFGTLLHITEKYLASIMDDSMIICDEVIKSYDEEYVLIKRKQSVKHRISIFFFIFY